MGAGMNVRFLAGITNQHVKQQNKELTKLKQGCTRTRHRLNVFLEMPYKGGGKTARTRRLKIRMLTRIALKIFIIETF